MLLQWTRQFRLFSVSGAVGRAPLSSGVRRGKRECHRYMKIPGLRSSYETVGGIVSFGRLLDKIRLNAQGKLPEGWFTGPQVGADRRCVSLLERVLKNGLTELPSAGP
jgi:hypothetical protein